jgi:hypothetical protein
MGCVSKSKFETEMAGNAPASRLVGRRVLGAIRKDNHFRIPDDLVFVVFKAA